MDGEAEITDGDDRAMMEEVQKMLEGRDPEEVRRSTAKLIKTIQQNLEARGQMSVEIPGGSIPMYRDGPPMNITERLETPVPPPARFGLAVGDALR